MAKTTYFGVRVDPELVKLLRERAAQNERSVGRELGRILRAALIEDSNQTTRTKRQSRKES